MLRTVFALAVATLIFAAVSEASQAAPIAPLSGVTTDSGQVTKVWWRHRHCWRGPYGHLHCGW